MIYIHFTLDGIPQKEAAIFEALQDMQYFIKNYEKEVLLTYPNATDIRLGECFVPIDAD
jgi:hypothetical protein